METAVYSERSQISTSASELRGRKRQCNVGLGEEEMLEDLQEGGEMECETENEYKQLAEFLY